MKPNTYSWTFWLLISITTGLLTYNPLYLTTLLILLILISISLKINLKKQLQTSLIFGTLPLAVNTFFVHKGATVLTQIPLHFNILSFKIPILLFSGPITLESITFGLSMALLLTDMILAFGIFSSSTTPDSLLRIMPKFFFNSSLLISIALRFTPVISDDMQAIKDAQRSRGLNLSQGNLFSRILKHKSLIIPTMVTSLERSLNLAESLSLKSYSKNRTKYFTEKWSKLDIAIFASLITYSLILIWSKTTGLLAYWPYEKIMPSFSLIPIMAISLLVTPVLKKWLK